MVPIETQNRGKYRTSQRRADWAPHSSLLGCSEISEETPLSSSNSTERNGCGAKHGSLRTAKRRDNSVAAPYRYLSVRTGEIVLQGLHVLFRLIDFHRGFLHLNDTHRMRRNWGARQPENNAHNYWRGKLKTPRHLAVGGEHFSPQFLARVVRRLQGCLQVVILSKKINNNNNNAGNATNLWTMTEVVAKVRHEPRQRQMELNWKALDRNQASSKCEEKSHTICQYVIICAYQCLSDQMCHFKCTYK